MIDGQEPITIEGGERLTPADREAIQDWYARRYLALRTAIPELCDLRRDLLIRDRRKSVRDTLDPRKPWPRVWHRHDSSRTTLADLLPATGRSAGRIRARG